MGADRVEHLALIADDDEFFRMALSTILKKRLGFTEVIEAASFDEAVECLDQARRVSLALFDLAMPGIDSPSALRTIRGSFEVDRLAVISASKQRRDILLSLEAGAHGFVSKDQGVDELESALRQILDGEMYVPPGLADLAEGECRLAEAPPRGSAAREARGALPEEVPHLTPRQRDVLELLVQGKSNKEIARALDLGPGTIKVHLAALFRNLGVGNRSAAAVAGAQLFDRLATAPGQQR